MTVFTNVSDDVLEPGDPIRSVDILAIKENTNYNHENTVLEILQEDIFTTSGTFTKATGFDDDDTVMIFLVGGGGSGGAVRLSSTNVHGVATGGFAGCCAIIYGRYADLTSTTWDLTVGAGGEASSRTTDGGITFGLSGNASLLLNSTTGARFVVGQGNAGHALNGSAVQNIFNYTESFGSSGRGSAVNLQAFFSGFLSISTVLFPAPNSKFTGGRNPIAVQGNLGARSGDELTTADAFSFGRPGFQIVGSGGSAARQGGTNRTSWNAKVPAFFNTGGDGSGTADGQNATGIGGGGGACVRPAGTTATSGAGGNGGMIVRYYRGRVSPFQVLGEVGA